MSLRGLHETDLFIVWQRSMYDDQEHAITDEEFAYGDRKDDGHYEAVCGHVLCMADSFAAPGRKCHACWLFVRARETMQPLEERLAPPSNRLLVRLKTMFCYKRPRHAAGEVQDA
jgi:hypothetical protein